MERVRDIWKPSLSMLCALALGACGTLQRDRAPEGEIDPSTIPDAVPKVEPRSRYGNPEFYEVNGERYFVLPDSRGYVERGTASWYGTKFHGRRTSSGEPYDMYAMTAAHRTLPLPTYVRVTHLDNGRSVVVKVNDRGPFHDNRLIDLSYAAAAKLDMLDEGTAPVEVRAIEPLHSQPAGVRFDPATPTNVVQDRPEVTIATANEEGDRFYVQTGAFSDQRNAEMLRSALSESGAGNVRIVEDGTADGRVLFKVRVGPLADRETALRLKERLAASGITAPHIVTE